MRPLTTKRISWIDSLRGFAILLIVIGHMPWSMSFFGKSLVTFIYSFHVPLFFIISGFFLTHNLQYSSIEYIKKISWRLLLPFWGWGIFLILFFNLNILFQKNAMTAYYLAYKTEFSSLYLFTGGRLPVWFLTALWSSLIFVVLLRRVLFDFSQRYIILLILFFIVLIRPVYKEHVCSFQLDILPVSIFFVWLGHCFYAINTERISPKKMEWLIVAFCSIGFCFAYMNGRVDMASRIFHNRFLYLGASSFISLGFILIWQRLTSNRLLDLLGRNTIFILGIHFPIQIFLSFILVKFGLSNELLFWTIAASDLIIILVVVVLWDQMGKKIKGRWNEVAGRYARF